MRGIVVISAALAAELVAGYAHPAMFQRPKRDIEEPSISITQSVPPLGTSSVPPPKISTRVPPLWPPSDQKHGIFPTIPVPGSTGYVHPDRRSDQAKDGLGSIISDILPLPTSTIPLDKRSPDEDWDIPRPTVYTILPRPGHHPPDKRSPDEDWHIPRPTIYTVLPRPPSGHPPDKRSPDEDWDAPPPVIYTIIPPAPSGHPPDKRSENEDEFIIPTPPPCCKTPGSDHLDRGSEKGTETVPLPQPSLLPRGFDDHREKRSKEKEGAIPTTLPDILALTIGIGGGLI